MDRRRGAAIGALVACLWTPAIDAGEPANPDHIDAAGCLVATPDGFVMGINRLIDRLQLPVGRHRAGETARETAARETMEETGLAVTVGDAALTLDDGRVVFYFCEPMDATVDFAALQPTDRIEVSRAMVVNPLTLATPDGDTIDTAWRFPRMRWLLRSVYSSMTR